MIDKTYIGIYIIKTISPIYIYIYMDLLFYI